MADGRQRGPLGHGAPIGSVRDGTLIRNTTLLPGVRRAPATPDENVSQHFGAVVSLSNTGWVECTRIYFKTGEASLGPDDRVALYRTVDTLRNLLVRGNGVDLECESRADVRGDAAENQKLSEKRKAEVERLLKDRLAHLKGWSLLNGNALGESRSSEQERSWIEDRRLTLRVRVILQAAEQEEGLKWARTRTRIFERHYPRYDLWRSRGLGYLVEQFEQSSQLDYPIKIKPGDHERVLDLIKQVARPNDWAKIEVWADVASEGVRQSIISDAYCVEYMRAYDEAFHHYSKSTEYGSLSPPGASP